jgi:hypothetical protein
MFVSLFIHLAAPPTHTIMTQLIDAGKAKLQGHFSDKNINNSTQAHNH